jgi:Domain of unknown function (DUF4082)/Cadherin-like domain/Bacterial Ig domain
MLGESSNSLTVSENRLATKIGIAAPVDSNYSSSALTVTVTALPSDGTILLADDITPISLGQSLTVNQLTNLTFRPALNSFGTSSSFGFTVSDPAGAAANATATLTIGPATVPLLTSWTGLSVPPNSPATPIAIQAPTDSSYAASALSVHITGLPTNGTVFLSDGTTVATLGQTLSVAQLTGLLFKSAANGSGEISSLNYSVSDPAGKTATGAAMVVVSSATPPVIAPTQLTVATNSGVTPIGISAPVDASFSSAALTVNVTGLPTDGKVFLSDGTTQVSAGQSLTVAQLTGLTFAPTTGASAQTSSFNYSVTDPSGASAAGTATLDIGPSNTPLVTTPASLTVAENGGTATIGIVAPSDASFAASALSVTVTGLPTDGTVLLSNGTTPVTMGESLTVAQLTGLMFKPTQDSTGQTSTFTYSVSDPAAHSANGSVTLATGPNAIVLENEKPGTPQSIWQINPGQDSTVLQGYTTSISTNVGGAVDFKVDNLTGSGNYQIDIYRLGYYGGDGARLVDTIQHQSTTAIVQPNPIVDPTTGLVDAGNWSVTDAWNVPSDAVSGVYVANIVQGTPSNPTQIFQIPFVVKDSSSTSDIVFQTSDETWQAYNGWGGADLYGGNGPAPAAADDGGLAAGAAYAVSYNRPITTLDSSGVDSGPQDTVFGAEYSAIYWLEENGYDVSYISGMDTATDGSLLLNHKIFMDAGHDEYWTDSQVANVQAAANAGVNLAFMSGNEMFWQTRFEPSIDGSTTANRTLVSYKDSHFGTVVDPNGTGTGTFEGPTNMGGAVMPSNALTGTLFQMDASLPSAITIPYGETQLRIWRNTSVANTAPGQTATLASDLLGYEWDSSPDNGYQPVGLVDLSSTTVTTSSVYNTFFGNVDTSGTATHNLVEYRDPTSGALVFGAGTVFWSWGLADQSDSGTYGTPQAADPSVQQAMVNLFADMGVQPSTLQATLAIASESTDHTPPKSTISQVSTTAPVEGQSVTVTGTATDAGGGVIAAVDVSTDGGKTWNRANSPVGAVTENWTFTFNAPAPGTYTIETRAVDDSLNLETPGPGVSYTVSPSSALTLFSPSATPATANVSDPNGVEVGLKFQSTTNGQITGIRFYKGALNTGTHVVDLWSAAGTLLATATSSNETASGWQQVSFSNPVDISAGTTYIASYHMTSGEYSDTPYYFETLQAPTNGSLTATVDGLNGVFAYSSGSIFPTNVSDTGDNYWVDVVFDDTSLQPQANNVSGLTVAENSALNLPASTLLANDTDPSGFPFSITSVSSPSNGTVSYNAQTQSVTFTPTAGYAGAATFNYTITDSSGASGTGQVSLNVTYPTNAQSLFGTNATPSTPDSGDTSSIEVGVEFTASVNGVITGIRFYKGASNTGPHVADLWSSTGTLLATATFTNETASGWQEVNFSTPVAVTAGTTYVASYHTNGDYSASTNYFTSPITNGELTALGTGNGVYAYGSGSVFPTATYKSTNYWVDVVFDGTAHPLANAASGFVVNKNGSISIAASTLLANDGDTGGFPIALTGVSNPLNGTVSYDPNTQIITFVPTAGYTGTASFTYTIGDTNGGTASAGVSLFVNDLSAETLFSLASTPSVVTANDSSPVELGVKFTADASGLITGLRFYKGPQNTGPHVADLWSSTGTLLATANFTNETPSGWQQVNFATPVAITAGATYVASYHTSGNYSINSNYFANPLVSGDLTAPAASNGVYAYGATDTFPTGTYGDSNYWVDVVYTRTAQAPVANNDGGFVVGENSSVTIAASALLANDTDPNGLPLSITGVSNPINGTVSYDANATTVTFVPTAGYTGAASFSYAISDGQAPGSSATVSLSVTPPPPVANNDNGFITNENGSITIAVSTLLASDTDPNGLPISFADVSNPLNGTVSYNANAQTVTFVPTAGYTGAASFSYSITDADGGIASANVGLFVNDPSTESLFSLSSTPSVVTVNDPNSVELGVKFTAEANGLISGLRFYKGPQNTGPHVADLWSSSGTLLATATFTNETASGWQQANFSSPVAITAGTTYVASYHSNGDYSTSSSYFTNQLVSGDLTAPASGNGVYAYGSTSIFPTNTFNAGNYWVDVVYTKTLQPPVANNDSGFVATENGSVTIAASTLLASDTDPNGLPLSLTGVSNATNGAANYNASNQTVTFVPNANYTGTASFTYSIADSTGGTASATASLLVNDPTTVSLFNPTTAPSIAAVNDPSSIELGVKFQATENGEITGLLFYKGPGNTGPHAADLWSSTGTLLATANFTNETPSGWQQVNFSSPVAITAGTTYVASYHTNSGDYAADSNLFATAVTNGPLTAPSSASSGGNGVYAYGSGSLFPTSSFNSTSYGVDVLFKPQLAA